MEGSTITKAGGEVRRIHIIYFLSRMGRIEHPHLIRVHHLNRSGVYLRDVKRWLADLRGKDMPESFAWSYKRRYKNGYVWQDLVDDDLITPISDNEYVLKGSEIFVPNTRFDATACGEKKASMIKDDKHTEVEGKDKQQEQPLPTEADPTTNSLTKTPSENSQESPTFCSEISTLTEESTKQEEDLSKCSSHEEQAGMVEILSSSFYSNLLAKMKKKSNSNKSNNFEKMGTLSSFSSSSHSSQASFGKSKSHSSSGTSKMFRNLITCGAIDTNDSVLVALNKSSSKYPPNNSNEKNEICKGEMFGGSARVFGAPWNQQQQHKHSARKSFDGVKGPKKKQQQSEFGSSKVVSDAYKPVGAPTCSQCRKPFKPEKLHTHMKSCKGMKALAKTAAASSEKTPHISVNSSLKNQLASIS